MDMHAGMRALNEAKDRWNAGDLPGYLRLYHDEVVAYSVPGVEPGIASLTQFYEAFFAAFPDSTLTFEDIFSLEDKVVCRFLVRGTHAGPFQGMPPTHKSFSLAGITILRFVGEKCVERWSQSDFLSLLQQLGAIAGNGAR